MTVLLTFLGTGKYEPCHYKIENTTSRLETFFSAALSAHLKPSKIISLETAAASETHGKELSGKFKSIDIPHTSAIIPDGKSESELWEIFDVLTKSVPDDCTLHLDITHGFRSLPLIGFIALNYLRTTRNVTLGGIHYGAWEARDEETNVTPSFNLTPFLTLLDWTSAADQYLATGSANRLGKLLKDTQQSLWKKHGSEENADLPKALTSLGSCIETAANDCILLRTKNLPISAKSVKKQIERINETSELERHAPAFLEILQPVQKDLTRFNNTDLTTLRDLIGWLVEKNRPDAALTLASEWLVSWVMVQLDNPDHISDESHRKPYDQCLNLWIDEHSTRNEIKDASEESIQHLNQLKDKISETDMELLANLVDHIKSARNDLNHAGFRTSPSTAENLIKKATEISTNIQKLPLPRAEK